MNEGRRKKEEGRGFEVWIQTPTQNGRPFLSRGIKPPSPELKKTVKLCLF
ncbi:MAG: hypothetical protein KME60_22605 [Cyanomargarita calcarea GSE-NOS-MK-12-04C]|jgi:hypothetical protein|uniref:Uncharacterized protein n=1 Tax=Cyanomargarita calcarea GSE-NOS-MK-12-04C TaxID=2839659 RepID=A0A951UUU5_9CYAN|nr:hypothetical protein [Cyanomargarita calcarea GSE-NOS-MK-12-04C]